MRSPRTTTPSTPRSTRSPATCSATRRLIERSAQAHSAVKKQIDHLKTQEGAPLVDAFEALRRLVRSMSPTRRRTSCRPSPTAATTQQLDGLGARILQAKQRGG